MDNQIKAALVLGAMIGATFIIATVLRTYFALLKSSGALWAAAKLAI